ncbi:MULTISPECIES: GNAT family N-acetyltransferase [unclassified Arthrobacter]|uniref:GNAT family N-acetyltransferase n=1 Tax=unclassified Arthrobacter TaxID=235627 RepID=UPI001D13EEA4|nr:MULTISPECIES: GNAT family N-acetyltransferase [unclassified Arthrobacter]MCC3289694.1 GNAT family N-acetyltransferase [Arthrobacter sp. zg-Y1110]MCC3300791.1 GNAT family N-acetyltransferase [Arthrobacter sp. zg-Y895]MCQ1986120.1 GNAT family N-acetyltransferase [Arthrobacter sp. zg-Y844]MCQ1994137.1 GNAT family N-acetyltransferase [Arthrobacter sp. zg-Y1171]UWX81759.1 GNAT family N-acetyltransferase [Arthrobacter sp. zg-Y1171]
MSDLRPFSGFRPYSTPHLRIREVPWSNPVGADLREAQQAELDARYGTAEHDPNPPRASDSAVFLIAYERSTGQPLGCGGLRRLDTTTAEIKRVYVLPYARGSGVATAVLGALEARAKQMGFAVLTAEAGSAQPDGHRFYENAGYRVVPNFGPYIASDGSTCYSKTIGAALEHRF